MLNEPSMNYQGVLKDPINLPMNSQRCFNERQIYPPQREMAERSLSRQGSPT